MRRRLTVALGALAAVAVLFGVAQAQQKTISIGTGGTGGVYYPLGGGLANVLTKAIPGVQATAEVTGVSNSWQMKFFLQTSLKRCHPYARGNL